MACPKAQHPQATVDYVFYLPVSPERNPHLEFQFATPALSGIWVGALLGGLVTPSHNHKQAGVFHVT